MANDNNEGVGYGRPPKQHQFKRGQSGNPQGRPKRPIPERVRIASMLEEPVTVTIKGKREKLQVFEVGLRNLVQKAVKERHLLSTIQLLKQGQKLDLIQKPSPLNLRNAIEIPKDWDQREWDMMFNEFGPPPWPGPRDGLSADDRARLQAPAFKEDIQHYPVPERRRANQGRRDLLRSLFAEVHDVAENGQAVKRSTLHLLLLVLRFHAAAGSIRAMDYMEKLHGEYGTPLPPTHRGPFVIYPEALTMEEWIMRYGVGSEEDRRQKIAELRKTEEEEKKSRDRNPQ